ncbi:MAG TPA: SPFH domain-containing protein [Gammaproteobacteria bacterium]|nr:SPFH domain-containing protein [Gammaproteobacteria bacterium]
MLRTDNNEIEPVALPDHHPTRVGDNESIYDALDRMGLLRQPNSWSTGHLVRKGEVGMCSDNGVPVFLAPGRHILWSPYNAYKGNATISDKMIRLGQNIEIVTIDQSEIGLSVAKGKNILLEPGQHILQAPQRYVKSVATNQNYVRLGTHHRISVPIGNVAVAYNEGRKLIITPVPLLVDKAHEEYIICTDGKMFTINSPTFMFDPASGFKSIQMEDIALQSLTVNTSEMISLSVVGSVRYQIVDPVRAFLMTENVEEDIVKQANATLTSVFSQLSIDEIASSIASTNVQNMKGKEGSQIPHDMLHHATDLFMREFQEIVRGWGVDAKIVNITSLQLVNETFRQAVQSRAEQSMQANTKLAVVKAQTDVELQEADRNRQKTIIDAEAKAEAIRKIADADVYAAVKKAECAKSLASEPLAERLAIMKAQSEIVGNLGDKTIITDLKLGSYGLRDLGGQMMWLNSQEKTDNANKPVAVMSPSLNSN